MVGIEAYGAYLPTARLDQGQVGAILGSGRGRGTRPVAPHDEDTTTMGVAAARLALRSAGAPGSVWFATTRPAYLEKSNASTVAVAAGLAPETAAYDVSGALRGGAGALSAGLATGSALVVASDMRFGLPGSIDESGGADAAVAFVVGPDPVAELIGSASLTSEFLDRWREPGETRTRTWEERFGVEEYVPLVQRVVDEALGRCGLKRELVDHVVVSLPHPRALGVVRRTFEPGQLEAAGSWGYAGSADLGLQLAFALDAAEPGQVVLAVSGADGADAFVFRVTEKHAASGRSGIRSEAPTPQQLVSYADYLTWRGLLPREPARRPDVKPPVPPASRRTAQWKFAFVAGRCTACDYRNLPPRRVCLRCSAVDASEPISMVDVPARVATYSDDWLSESVQLPAKVVAVDFDGGGRFEFEMTDAVGHEVAIGDRVQPTFRLASVAANGVRNYVWKVRPHDGQHERPHHDPEHTEVKN